MSKTGYDAKPFIRPRYEEQDSEPENDIPSTNNISNIPEVQLPDFMIRPSQGQPLFDEPTRQQKVKLNRDPKPTIVKQESVVETRRDEIVYPMNSRPKGLFLCINNINFEDHVGLARRDGAERDEEDILLLFRKLGYRTQCFRDLDYSNFKKCIKEFKERPELKNICSVVVSIMSHGEGTKVLDTDIVTTDGIRVNCEWIIDQFDFNNCPAMHKKPKIFLFQFCRGEGIGACPPPWSQPGKVANDGLGSSRPSPVRVGDDVLIAFPTIRGNVAHRHVTTGSWFIQAICRVYARYACDSDIRKLQSKVDIELENNIADNELESRQTCETVERGFRDFYFFPGVY